MVILLCKEETRISPRSDFAIDVCIFYVALDQSLCNAAVALMDIQNKLGKVRCGPDGLSAGASQQLLGALYFKAKTWNCFALHNIK